VSAKIVILEPIGTADIIAHLRARLAESERELDKWRGRALRPADFVPVQVSARCHNPECRILFPHWHNSHREVRADER
jgi:hypothetical protein